jgi:uncharacterized protein YxjI
MNDNGHVFLISERRVSTAGYSAVLDERGIERYRIRKKVSSPRDKVVIEDLSGGEVASVHRHLIVLPLTYEIRISGEKVAKIRQKPFARVDDSFTVDVLGNDDLEIKGDLTNHEYVFELSGDQVAEVSKRRVNIPETFAIRVVDSVDPLLVIGSVIGLEMLLERNDDDDQDDDDQDDGEDDDDQDDDDRGGR